MTRWTLAGALALGAMGAIGAFTPGAATAEAATSVSPFAGSWSGTFSVTDSEDPDFHRAGTFDWTISDAGRIEGTVYDTTVGSSGTMVGHVGADGNLLMVGYVPNDAPATGFNGYAFEGTAVIDGDGRLVASVTRTDSTSRSLVAILERD